MFFKTAWADNLLKKNERYKRRGLNRKLKNVDVIGNFKSGRVRHKLDRICRENDYGVNRDSVKSCLRY